ncbi:energy-coupling factor transporter transmembrane protein EcfT, partial [Candidatus Bathyarchaeota archaeon]|nr:energy-coupling factor transporter transmembrane protein EcfT [Candidatus Bathyarchaeota archaeon]
MSVFDGLKFRKVYSPIHDLDPRMKFIYVCGVFVVAIIFGQILPLAALFIFQIPFVLLARVQRQWLRSLRGALFLAAFIFFVNIASSFLTEGYVLTAIKVESAAAMTLRFIVLVESFSVFFLTTSPDHLGLALEQSRV